MTILLLLACSGDSEPNVVAAAPAGAVAPELVSTTWQVRLAPDAARTSFEGRPSWTAYFQGNRKEALAAMVSESDPVGLARLHAELAGLYDEAALLAAKSVQQVYGADRQPTDPIEVSYLLAQAGVLLGDATLRANAGAASASKVPDLAARDAALRAWVDGGAAWPPDAVLATLPGKPPEVATPGELPSLGPAPTYALPEQTPDALAVKSADLLAIWSLARHHERVAQLSQPADPGIALLINAHRVPGDQSVGTLAVPTPSVSDTVLFLGPYTTAGDLALDAELRNPALASTAVERHQADSPYAVIIQRCSTPELSPDCVVDQASVFGTALQDAMGKAAGGPQDFHRFFADFARAGVFRVAANAAFAAGNTDAGGRLRLNAIDRYNGKAWDPLFTLSTAAWDAGNRNAVRATEAIHPLVDQFPGLDVARLPLDALHVRLSRNAAPGVPMH